MASPNHVILLTALALVALCRAGPLGPLPNVTSSDLGLKEGSCALGDVVYMSGDEFPGSSPCERCRCAGGGVHCARQRCEPRPGCKALHRPDHCCPIYQCECEQEGRVYGNGEKLVDPQDPCRVCYCQGGEVVCRRIACFVRDDCRPRLVPGRCCPEYDNCPLRGVTTVPGVASSISTISTMPEVESSPAPSVPKENIKQEITIKEITPVSEIPVITEVKIKEILPSPNIEVAEYSSSKSPLIVREATSERTVSRETEPVFKTDGLNVVEVQPSSSSISITSLSPEEPTKSSESYETKTTNDKPPSKISFSTQDSINSEIYPSVQTSISTLGIPTITQEFVSTARTTKAPIIEDEDTSLFDHNPAFPPIPDDLSVLSNHEDENIAEQNMDGDHVSVVQEVVTSSHSSPTMETVTITEPVTTTLKEIYETTSAPKTVKISEISEKVSTLIDNVDTEKIYPTIGTESVSFNQNPMINIRSAIPTEILNIPSLIPEEVTGELDDVDKKDVIEHNLISTTMLVENTQQADKTTQETELFMKTTASASFSAEVTNAETTTYHVPETTTYAPTSATTEPQTTSAPAKSYTGTEITAQTEFSSISIETSDQKPHEISERIAKEKAVTTTTDSQVFETPSTKIYPPIEAEIITVSRTSPSNTDNQSFENIETTEFILTPFGSSESATDSVELIKISADPEKRASIIDTAERKNTNVLTDFIKLVDDVASIGDHTESPDATREITTATSISDSEELIPVNAGYKSKNNNWNPNSITEIPIKIKSQPNTKPKILEIEGDDTESITDSPAPYDKIEPTTRRPIIDNVSDDMPENKTEKKDIEIITKSYVPTINKRPTKVVMKKTVETPVSETTELSPASNERWTESNVVSTSGLSETSTTVAPQMSTTDGRTDERMVTQTSVSTAAH